MKTTSLFMAALLLMALPSLAASQYLDRWLEPSSKEKASLTASHNDDAFLSKLEQQDALKEPIQKLKKRKLSLYAWLQPKVEPVKEKSCDGPGRCYKAKEKGAAGLWLQEASLSQREYALQETISQKQDKPEILVTNKLAGDGVQAGKSTPSKPSAKEGRDEKLCSNSGLCQGIDGTTFTIRTGQTNQDHSAKAKALALTQEAKLLGLGYIIPPAKAKPVSLVETKPSTKDIDIPEKKESAKLDEDSLSKREGDWNEK